MRTRKGLLLTIGDEIIGTFTKLTDLIDYTGKHEQVGTIRRDLKLSDSVSYGDIKIEKTFIFISERSKRK